jgi:hypothetical protein
MQFDVSLLVADSWLNERWVLALSDVAGNADTVVTDEAVLSWVFVLEFGCDLSPVGAGATTL